MAIEAARSLAQRGTRGIVPRPAPVPQRMAARLGRLGRAERATSIGLVIGAVASVQLGAAIATTLFDELGPAGHGAAAHRVRRAHPGRDLAPGVPRARQRAASRRGAPRARARGDEPELLRGARPDPARDRGDARVHGAVRGRGRRLAARQRPLLGGARRGRASCCSRRASTARSTASGSPSRCSPARFWAAYIVLAARVGRAFSGGQRAGPGDGRGDGRAGPGRRRRRRRRRSATRACSPSGSRWRCSARRSRTRWSSRRCGGSGRGRSAC